MENYINGRVVSQEVYDYKHGKVRAVARTREGGNKLTLLVLGMLDKDARVPSGEWAELSRSIRRQMLYRSMNVKESKRVREIFRILLEEDIYFINDETDAGRVPGNPGVYAHG
ncbi:hypothetical protein HY449_04680 [Candidatus Pacearchaeota archaeon]|nr:hypothetical protein [Candidatus Pacearchaeota archaeon]